MPTLAASHPLEVAAEVTAHVVGPVDVLVRPHGHLVAPRVVVLGAGASVPGRLREAYTDAATSMATKAPTRIQVHTTRRRQEARQRVSGSTVATACGSERHTSDTSTYSSIQLPSGSVM
jgi:hypothetical protein